MVYYTLGHDYGCDGEILIYITRWKRKVKTAIFKIWKDNDINIIIEKYYSFDNVNYLEIKKSELDDRTKLSRKIDDFL